MFSSAAIRFYFRYMAMLFILLAACTNSSRQGEDRAERTQIMDAGTDLVIGLEDQPLEHQLGRPVAVRTDEEHNIYIADRASMEIKVFDREGTYLRSIGGRGRGPGELQDIELMELTPEGHFVVMDRGNLQYTIISAEGEQIDAFPYNLSDQFYPGAVAYTNGELLSLFLKSPRSYEVPYFERDLFHIYSTDFQEQKTSFMPVKQLGFDEMFLWIYLAAYQGSFSLSPDEQFLIYSPGTYTGTLQAYQKNTDGQWQADEIVEGMAPNISPYQEYRSEQQFRSAQEAKEARASRVRYGGETYFGRQLSTDAGVFHLEDGRIVHFYAEWREGYESSWPDSDNHQMDLYAQVFDRYGTLQTVGFLFPYSERLRIAMYPVVNWMDEEGRFYLIEHPDDVPVVRRFSLNLPE